ncbi:hypothetical protein [Tindallia californiensis]|uniref:hypothetical protein n=1 Tax=Tindallia californiensis TaxID=159292 RepID=UPI00115F81F7|nr:hypothetical protein [Tindallia californiensis]
MIITNSLTTILGSTSPTIRDVPNPRIFYILLMRDQAWEKTIEQAAGLGMTPDMVRNMMVSMATLAKKNFK